MELKLSEKAYHAFKNRNWDACLHFAKRCLDDNPEDHAAAYYLATILHLEEKHEEALKFIDAFSPSFPSLCLIKNLTLQAMGQIDKAAEYIDQATKKFPEETQLKEAKKALEGYLKSFHTRKTDLEQQLESQPDKKADLLLSLGDLSLESKQFIVAKEYYQSIEGDEASSFRVLYRLGASLFKERLYSSAIEYFNQALEKAPAAAAMPIHYYLGLIYSKLNDHTVAKGHFEKVVASDSNYLAARLNLSLSCLCLGDWKEGWEHFSYRPRHQMEQAILNASVFYKQKDSKGPFLPAFSSFEELKGEPIFLIAEQGLGDQLFFLRYANKLHEKGVKLILCLEERMTNLLAERLPFPVQRGLPPQSKNMRVLILGDLPCVEDIDPIPTSLSLKASEERVDKFKKQLGDKLNKPIIALSWRAGVRISEGEEKTYQYKEAPLSEIIPLLKQFNGNIIVVQRFLFPEEWQLLQAELGEKVIDFSEVNRELDDMLALLSLADHYLCVSNTNTHLSEALGLDSSVLVPSPWEWRWSLGDSQSKWFKHSKVYKQSTEGDWSEAFKVLAKDLEGVEKK